MIILGLNAWHGDASAALFIDGRLVAAAEEERFTRVKHESGFPARAVQWCLEAAGASIADVDIAAVPRDPWARWRHKLAWALRFPRFSADRARVAATFSTIDAALADATGGDAHKLRARIRRVEHHRAHIASAFFASPFDRAAVLSLDGLGDFASGLSGVGEGTRLRIERESLFPHSLGIWFSAVTQYLGFPHYGDEYKVMGLAAYGAPSQLDEMRRLVRDTDRGLGYQLDLPAFRHPTHGPGITWTGGAPSQSPLFGLPFESRFGPRRAPTAEIDDRHRDIAASLQARLDELIIAITRRAAQSANSGRLAYAGGVAYNCVSNGRALAANAIEELYIPPAPGDAGLAIGAGLYVWHHELGKPREHVITHAYWGEAADEPAIARALAAAGIVAQALTPDEIAERTAALIADGRIVGWYQGRMEFGPRALGGRSILADPRRSDMKEVLNSRIKRRESFRPFAPSVLEECASEWFEMSGHSPFMLVAHRVLPSRATLIPAVTHVDGTARVQTVARETNPMFHALLSAFHRQTGVPVVLNTSFNENEPIVRTPEEAVHCFLRADMDVLAIGPYVVERAR